MNQEKLNAIEKLGSAIFDFEIVNINNNQNHLYNLYQTLYYL